MSSPLPASTPAPHTRVSKTQIMQEAVHEGTGIKTRLLFIAMIGLLGLMISGGTAIMGLSRLSSAQNESLAALRTMKSISSFQTLIAVAHGQHDEYFRNRHDDAHDRLMATLSKASAAVQEAGKDPTNVMIRSELATLELFVTGLEETSYKVNQRQTIVGSTANAGLTGKLDGVLSRMEAAVQSASDKLQPLDLAKLQAALARLRASQVSFGATLESSFEGAFFAEISRFERYVSSLTALPGLASELKGMATDLLSTFEKWVKESKDVDAEFREASNQFTLSEPVLAAMTGKVLEVEKQLATELSRIRDNVWLSTLLALGIVMLVGIAMFRWVARSISIPLIKLKTAMDKLARGEALDHIPNLKRQDEIGVMARAVAVFRDITLERERLTREQLETAELNSARGQTITSASERFDFIIRETAQAVGNAALMLQDASEELGKASAEVSSRSHEASVASTGTAVKVESLAAAAEELAGSIREIASQTTRSADVAERAVRQGESTKQHIEQLTHAAARIGEIVELINSIASQTNLLALNATIEAARAGAAGRGFAVVASEIKALAVQTATATADIDAQVNAIRGASKGTADSFTLVNSVLMEVQGVSTAIAAAMTEQESTVQQISGTMASLSQDATVSADAVENADEAAKAAAAVSENVAKLSVTLLGAADKLGGSVDEFLTTVRAA
jgi:methyl-accepting chemotaxis protein